MLKCSYCGNKVDLSTDKFCNECGSFISIDTIILCDDLKEFCENSGE